MALADFRRSDGREATADIHSPVKYAADLASSRAEANSQLALESATAIASLVVIGGHHTGLWAARSHFLRKNFERLDPFGRLVGWGQWLCAGLARSPPRLAVW
jgi:hypothetical protein